MIARGEKSILARFFVLARISKSNFDIREKHFWELDTITSCGSMPISFQKVNYSFEFDSSAGQYDTTAEMGSKIKAFLKVQDLCRENKIKLILVFSPNFKFHNPQFENRVKELCLPDVEYYVYDSTNSIYTDKAYFYDESHLLTNGAIIFTNEIIKFIKDIDIQVYADNN